MADRASRFGSASTLATTGTRGLRRPWEVSGLESVMATAAVAGFLGDQTAFFAGRRYGPRLLAWSPRLADATSEQRKNWRLVGRGQGIHWPDGDEDISVASLLKVA